jgi:galactokinase
MTLSQLVDHATGQFARCFDELPRYIVAAPGRVNVIGEHTDYNDGFVLPMAIDRHTVIAARKNQDQNVTLHSVTTGETARFALTLVRKGEPSWSNYVRGVIAGFQELGLKVSGFDAVIDSEVPLGGGLSSSAALEVATATLLEILTRRSLQPEQKALLCQKAEHEFAGVPCGIMDQFTSVMAKKDHLLLLDCRSRHGEFAPFKDPSLAVLIINTNVRHKLADGAYAQRRAQCEQAASAMKVKALRDADLKMLEAARSQLEAVVFRRARHVISENERTVQAAECFREGDLAEVGELMYASHASLRDDYEVSCSELDAVVAIAQKIGSKGGVIGCRMTGGGFGGCAVALVKSANLETIIRRVADDYEAQTRIIPTVFVSRPAAGATVIKRN